MRRTIDRKTYDTKTAALIAEDSYGESSDFSHWREELYRTVTGSWFLMGEGGPKTAYAKRTGTNWWGSGSSIRPLSDDEALEWCQDHGAQDAIDKHFSHLVEEA